MPLIIPGNVASATAAVTYSVANSCRFNDGDTAFMNKTPGSAGDRKTSTFSCWFKRGQLGTAQNIIYVETDTSNYERMRFETTDKIYIAGVDSASTAWEVTTTAVFRDCSAWYHLCIVKDTTEGTDTNRIKIYINNVLQTLESTTLPAEDHQGQFCNAAEHRIGKGNGEPFDGYLAEVVLIDGSALTPSSFGEANEDSPTIWQPIDVSGLTFGTTGFYLDFEASDNLGNDANGGTDLSESNLDATDSATDTPSNNFCVMNNLANFYAEQTFSQGNCKLTLSSGDRASTMGTFGLSAGKWYWEQKIATTPEDERFYAGIQPFESLEDDDPINATNKGVGLSGYNAVVYSAGSIIDDFYGNDTTRFDSFTGIIGVALDLTDGSEQITFSKGGEWITGSDTTDTDFSNADQVDLSGVTSPTGFWHPMAGCGNTGTPVGVYEMNFGGCSAFTVSSAVNDENGYGKFEYDVPSGYLALCSKNLGSDGG